MTFHNRKLIRRTHLIPLFGMLLCFGLLTGLFAPATALADITDTATADGSYHWPAGPQITSGGAILIEAETGTVLYEKNATERLYPASTTKLMTALLAL